MKNGLPELSDVSRLLEEWRSDGHKWLALLQARAALMDASNALMDAAARDGRGLKANEQTAVDAHLEQIREINGWLTEYKRQRIADLAAEGLPADYCRLPF